MSATAKKWSTPLCAPVAELTSQWTGKSPPAEWPESLCSAVLEGVDRAIQGHLADCTACRFQSKFERRRMMKKDEKEKDDLEIPQAEKFQTLCADGMDYMGKAIQELLLAELDRCGQELRDKLASSRPADKESTQLEDFLSVHTEGSIVNALSMIKFYNMEVSRLDAKLELIRTIEEEDELMQELQTVYTERILIMAESAKLRHAISNSSFYVIIPEVFVEFIDKKFAKMDADLKARIPAFEAKYGTFEVDGKPWTKLPLRTMLGNFSVSTDVVSTSSSLKAGGGRAAGRSLSPSPRTARSNSGASTARSDASTARTEKDGKPRNRSPSPRVLTSAKDKAKGVDPGVPISQPTILSRPAIGSAFNDSSGYTESYNRMQDVDPEDSCMQCVTRIRPLVWHEVQAGHQAIISPMPNGRSIRLTQKLGGKDKEHELTFLKVCDGSVNQPRFFEEINAKKLVDIPLKGLNSCLFAYGQTGSGKTFSVAGPMDVLGLQTNAKLKPIDDFPQLAIDVLDEMLTMHLKEQGLMPKLAYYLFDEIRKAEEADPNTRIDVRASYVEIYNEQVQDLLQSEVKNLPVREKMETGSTGYYAEGLTEKPIENLEEMLDMFVEAAGNRMVTAHKMNSESSRSHAILTIYIKTRKLDTTTRTIQSVEGKMVLVDLAGSESVKLTKTSGKSLQETAGINKSLLSLSNIVATLAETKGDPTSITGWRNSKLTMLLMDSLVGAGYTVMLACCSPSSAYTSETLSTLQFATRVANISKSDVVALTTEEMELKKLKDEIAELRGLNATMVKMLLDAGIQPPPGVATD